MPDITLGLIPSLPVLFAVIGVLLAAFTWRAPRRDVVSHKLLILLIVISGFGGTLGASEAYKQLRETERKQRTESAVELLAERISQQFVIAAAASMLVPEAARSTESSFAPKLQGQLIGEATLVRAIHTWSREGLVATHYAPHREAPANETDALATRHFQRYYTGEAPPTGRAHLLDVVDGAVDALFLLRLGTNRLAVVELAFNAALTQWVADIAATQEIRMSSESHDVFFTVARQDSNDVTAQRSVTLAGLEFLLEASPSPDETLQSYDVAVRAILVFGVLTTLIVAWMLLLYLRRAQRAQDQADAVTRSFSAIRTAFRAAPTPLVFFSEDGRILNVSDRWWQASGVSQDEEIPLKRWLDDAQVCEERSLEPLDLEAIKSFAGTVRLLDADGGERFWQVASAPVADSGAPAAMYVMIGNDITAARAARIELESTNAELDAFAYVASHDLRSPLRAIKSLATWVMEDVGDELPEAARDDLITLLQRVERMEVLLADLLAYSRIGRKEDAAEWVSMIDLVGQLRESLDVPPGATLQIEGDLPELYAPRAALRGVFANVIDNAFKHGGRDDLTVRISSRKSDGFSVFFIDDDGVGILPEFRERVFQIFERLDSSVQVTGSGMGLALVRKHVELYGGFVEIDASPAGGARLMIRWPEFSVGRKNTVWSMEDDGHA